MAKKIGKRTITVRREERRDPLDPTPSTPASHQILGCMVVPRTSFEEERGWVIVEGQMVVAPFGSDVKADDKILLPGDPEPWDVDGQPGHYENKRGIGKACIFYLTKVG